MLSEVAKMPKAASLMMKSDMPRLGQTIGSAASNAKTSSAIRQSRRNEGLSTDGQPSRPNKPLGFSTKTTP